MREIKFRAWHKIKKEICEVEIIRFCPEAVIQAIDSSKAHSFFDQIENFILLQFTGLEDDKGNEIFEGDIVHYEHPCDSGNYEIVIEDCALRFKGPSGKLFYNSSLFSKEETGKIEIIGNIYENPEALKGRD